MEYVTGTREYLSVSRCGRECTNIPARVFPDVIRHPARAICRVMRTSERYPSQKRLLDCVDTGDTGYFRFFASASAFFRAAARFSRNAFWFSRFAALAPGALNPSFTKSAFFSGRNAFLPDPHGGHL